MANNKNLIPIPGRLHSVATEGHVAGADEIYDDSLQKDQATINQEVSEALGEGGTVDEKIAVAVNALDATKSQTAGTDGLALSITEVDGKITSISGSIAANTYDANGAAATAKSEVLGSSVGTDYNTLKKIEDKLSPIETAVGIGGSIDSRIASAVATETTRAQGVESTLQANIDAEALRAQEAEAARYTKSETYTKEEVNNLITTPNQEYVSVTATDQTTSVTDVLPATGTANTIYRVGNYDGTQYNDSVFSEYAWNGSVYIKLSTKSQVGEVYDISINHAGAKYTDLTAALGVNGTNIPQSLQKGGMSIKFVQSSDNRYVQYRLMADNWSISTEDWSFGGNDVYVENPEFVYVKTDSEGKILWAIKKDGGIYYGAGVPQQVIDYIDKFVQTLLNKKVDKEEGKSLIDEEYAESISHIENPEFVEVKTDPEGKIIEGTSIHGDKVFNGSVACGKIKSKTIDEINARFENLVEKAEHKTTLEKFPFKKSKYVNREADTIALSLSIPEMVDTYTIIDVSNETELDEAISRYNNNIESLLLRITSDIAITTTKDITGSSKELILCGKHRIYQKELFYEPTEYRGGTASCHCVFSSINRTFIDSDGKILKFAKSKFYEAKSRIMNEDGSDATSDKGIKKFLLPDELLSLNLTESDNVYINFSSTYRAFNSKVLHITDGYLYFLYDGGFPPDCDYTFGGRFTSFCFINYGKINNSIKIQNNRIEFPITSDSIYDCGDFSGFNISNNSGIVKFQDIVFQGSSYSSNFIKIQDSTLIVENCTFQGFQNDVICGYPGNDSGINTKVYVLHSYFNELEKACVFMRPRCLGYISKCIIKNVGLLRENSNAIEACGPYYIADNIVEDYGYCGIRVGIWTIQNPDDNQCRGIVENNIVRQTPEYIRYADKLTLMDSGALYIARFNDNSVVRNNKVINYIGRGHNSGVYCDGGAFNFKLYSNVIISETDRSAIFSYNGGNDAGIFSNTNRVIAQNITTNNICLQGGDVANNGCFLGYNIALCMNSFPIVEDIEESEPQYKGFDIKVNDGTPIITIKEWDIN